MLKKGWNLRESLRSVESFMMSALLAASLVPAPALAEVVAESSESAMSSGQVEEPVVDVGEYVTSAEVLGAEVENGAVLVELEKEYIVELAFRVEGDGPLNLTRRLSYGLPGGFELSEEQPGLDGNVTVTLVEEGGRSVDVPLASAVVENGVVSMELGEGTTDALSGAESLAFELHLAGTFAEGTEEVTFVRDAPTRVTVVAGEEQVTDAVDAEGPSVEEPAGTTDDQRPDGVSGGEEATSHATDGGRDEGPAATDETKTGDGGEDAGTTGETSQEDGHSQAEDAQTGGGGANAGNGDTSQADAGEREPSDAEQGANAGSDEPAGPNEAAADAQATGLEGDKAKENGENGDAAENGPSARGNNTADGDAENASLPAGEGDAGVPGEAATDGKDIASRNGASIANSPALINDAQLSGEPLEILSQPADVRATEGQQAEFSVEASGTGVTYQWQTRDPGGTAWKNSTAAGSAGFNTDTLSVKATLARSGRSYRCVVTDASGATATSEAATLTVVAAPVITEQPRSLTLSAGETATFSVRASGTGLSYRWETQYAGSTAWRASTFTGCRTRTLSFEATADRSGRSYRCVVTDANGFSVESEAATLTVRSAPVILSQPANVRATEGQQPEFSVEASGTGVTYQWQTRDPGGTAWKNSTAAGSAGFNTDTLSVKATLARSGRSYRCVVTDASGATATSEAATLTVVAKPTITAQPEDLVTTSGKTATFSVKAKGTGLSYQWETQYAGSTAWRASTFTGCRTRTLSFEATADRSGRSYRCVVTDANGFSVESEAATLTVVAAPEITAQPQDLGRTVGQDATFSVAATGTGVTYQWQYQSPGKTTWGNSGAAGSKTDTLTINATLARSGQSYRCVVTDANGFSVESEAATLTVVAAPEVTAQPQDLGRTVGQDATFSVTATGTGITYQWETQYAGTTAWRASTFSGNKTDTLSFEATEARGGRKFRCVVTDANGATATSEEASLTVRPLVDVIPGSFSMEVGAAGERARVRFIPLDDANYSLSSTGGEGAHGYLLNASGTQLATGFGGQGKDFLVAGDLVAGQTYYWEVGFDGTTAGSVNLLLERNVGVGSFAATISEAGTRARFRFVPDASGSYTLTSEDTYDTYGYLYDASDNLLASDDDGGAGNNFLITHDLEAGSTYYWEVRYYGSSETGTIPLVLSRTAPTINSHPADVTCREGETAEFHVDAYGPWEPLTYQWQWQRPGETSWQDSGFAGNKTDTLSVAATAARDGRSYRCVVTDANGATVTSAEATLWVTNADERWFAMGDHSHDFSAGETWRAKYVPVESGSYTFFSMYWPDEYKVFFRLLDASNAVIASDEGSGFLATHDLVAQETYYVEVGFVDEGVSASFSTFISRNIEEGTHEINMANEYTINHIDNLHTLRFTPSTTGDYSFVATQIGSSYDGDVTPPYVELFNAEFGYMSGNYLWPEDIADGGETSLTHTLIAGQTYYWCVSLEPGAWLEFSLGMDEPSSTQYRALLVGEVSFDGETTTRNRGDVSLMGNILSSVAGAEGGGWAVTSREDLSPAQIRNAIATTFAGADSDDVSLFFIATHGDTTNTGRYAGALSTGLNSGTGTAVSNFVLFEELASWLNDVPGKVVVVVESCGSGAGVYEEGVSQNTATFPELLDEGCIDAFASANRTKSLSEDLPNVGELRVPDKFYVLTASRYQEESWGSETLGYNWFTKWLTDGVGTSGNMPCDTEWNGNDGYWYYGDYDDMADLDELFAYVSSMGDGNRVFNGNYYQHVQRYPTDSHFEVFRR